MGMKQIAEQYQVNRILYNPFQSAWIALFDVLFIYPKAEKQRQKFYKALEDYKGFNVHVEMLRAARVNRFIISSTLVRKVEEVLKVKFFSDET
jgi:hypothetical protein